MIPIRVQRLMNSHGLALPSRATPGAAGFDLYAAVEAPLVLRPMARALVPTGMVIEIPPGFEGQVRPRSGLASKQGVTVLNAPGTIDSDYRGEVCVILVNLGSADVEIRRGDRVAQLVIAAVADVELVEADEVSGTGRGRGGFGSTGM